MKLDIGQIKVLMKHNVPVYTIDKNAGIIRKIDENELEAVSYTFEQYSSFYDDEIEAAKAYMIEIEEHYEVARKIIENRNKLKETYPEIYL